MQVKSSLEGVKMKSAGSLIATDRLGWVSEPSETDVCHSAEKAAEGINGCLHSSPTPYICELIRSVYECLASRNGWLRWARCALRARLST